MFCFFWFSVSWLDNYFAPMGRLSLFCLELALNPNVFQALHWKQNMSDQISGNDRNHVRSIRQYGIINAYLRSDILYITKKKVVLNTILSGSSSEPVAYVWRRIVFFLLPAVDVSKYLKQIKFPIHFTHSHCILRCHLIYVLYVQEEVTRP